MPGLTEPCPQTHVAPMRPSRRGLRVSDWRNILVSEMHALRLNGAGSRLGSTVGSTRVAVCDDRRHRRLLSRVEHHLMMERMLALRYLLVTTSRSPSMVDLLEPSVNPSDLPVCTDGSAPSRLPRSDSADPSAVTRCRVRVRTRHRVQ